MDVFCGDWNEDNTEVNYTIKYFSQVIEVSEVVTDQ